MSATNPQPVVLDYVLPDGTTGSITLDASVNEQHMNTAQVTEHQVESGPNITDHIRPLPQKLSIEGMITNTPIASPPPGLGSSGATASDASVTARFAKQTRTNRAGATVGIDEIQVQFKVLQFSSAFDRVRDIYGYLIEAAAAGAIFSVFTTLHSYEDMAITNFAVPRNAEGGNAIRFSLDMQQLRIVDTQDVAAPAAKHKPKARGNKAPKEASANESVPVKESFAHALLK